MIEIITLHDDTLIGAAEIAKFIGHTLRQTHYLLDAKRLPAFQFGRQWRMRKSTYMAWIAELEADAIARTKICGDAKRTRLSA